ncbi:PREDICTED: uncharacterized protein LOC106148200 [Chinchilla lanigera]|uniref:uncharacterized protein LOC106148200 n=1 Tax=Chinchilla lanigera TaxID=34839 RepID=UPI000695F59E|nr:PREDICTED: uncharacterized protein LOC106148200 [Chinchilla lanigera]
MLCPDERGHSAPCSEVQTQEGSRPAREGCVPSRSSARGSKARCLRRLMIARWLLKRFGPAWMLSGPEVLNLGRALKTSGERFKNTTPSPAPGASAAVTVGPGGRHRALRAAQTEKDDHVSQGPVKDPQRTLPGPPGQHRARGMPGRWRKPTTLSAEGAGVAVQGSLLASGSRSFTSLGSRSRSTVQFPRLLLDCLSLKVLPNTLLAFLTHLPIFIPVL